MAAVTSAVIGVAAAGASIYMSAKQASDGAKQAKEAKEALDKYNRQKLENPYANLRVSQMAANLAKEESARNYANSVNALQSSGLTGLAMLPQLTATQNTLNRQIGADLDRQFIANENAKAGGNAVVQQMQEQREIADLAGLGQQLWVGQQNKYTGIQNTIKAIPAFASAAVGAYTGIEGQIKQAKVADMQSQVRENDARRANVQYDMYNPQFNSQLMPWTSQSLGGWY